MCSHGASHTVNYTCCRFFLACIPQGVCRVAGGKDKKENISEEPANDVSSNSMSFPWWKKKPMSTPRWWYIRRKIKEKASFHLPLATTRRNWERKKKRINRFRFIIFGTIQEHSFALTFPSFDTPYASSLHTHTHAPPPSHFFSPKLIVVIFFVHLFFFYFLFVIFIYSSKQSHSESKFYIIVCGVGGCQCSCHSVDFILFELNWAECVVCISNSSTDGTVKMNVIKCPTHCALIAMRYGFPFPSHNWECRARGISCRRRWVKDE